MGASFFFVWARWKILEKLVIIGFAHYFMSLLCNFVENQQVLIKLYEYI